MSKNIFAAVVTLTLAATAFAQDACLDAKAAGTTKKLIRVTKLVKGEGTITIVTNDSQMHNFKISDTLCFDAAKLEKLETASQTKEPITLVVKDNHVADIL
jgi:hypothetical protein